MLGQPYDTQADVFSMAILMWEMLSLKWAFQGYNLRDYYERVCKQNERLPINRSAWSAIIRMIMVEAWDKNPQKRPTMKRLGSLIRGDLQDMSADASVINRTQHMLSRSMRSFHLDNSSNHGGDPIKLDE